MPLPRINASFKDLLVVGEGAAAQVRQMEQNCKDFGLDLPGIGASAAARGVNLHSTAPEQWLASSHFHKAMARRKPEDESSSARRECCCHDVTHATSNGWDYTTRQDGW